MSSTNELNSSEISDWFKLAILTFVQHTLKGAILEL